MAGPLTGVRVVEVGIWVAGPAAAGILADWGADVIKIEPPSGDPLRGMGNPARRRDVNPPFELDNRGKRSVALNLADPEGYRIARRLIDGADVFVTNLLPGAVERLRLTEADLRAANPGLVYCRITGYGATGADRDRPGFDGTAFWARPGLMATMAEPGQGPPSPRNAVGDHFTAVAAAAAVCAALLARTRTGVGQLVDTSLYRTGVYAMSWDISMQLRVGAIVPQLGRRAVNNPLVNTYCAGDGRWFYLVNLQADRYWPGLCRAIGREDLAADPRFADLAARRQHAAELVDILDAVFATRGRDEWGAALDREGVIWAPVQSLEEVIADPQAVEAGAWVEVPDGAGGSVRMVAPPAGFSGTPAQPSGPPPEPGQHTEAVLLELGYSWEQIAALKQQGAIP
jgi:crotonobetainyl-CoA:carnitine CoA-transferase CaiB-like acyl-CoA transferase